MIEIKLPKASSEMTEGEVSEWLVPDGAAVTEGQPIYLLATDKVEMEIESPAAGVFVHVGTIGETYQVGELIAKINEPSD